MKFAFDNGHKMTPKPHVIAFIVSSKIFLMHFLYFFFGEFAYLPKSLSLEIMILKVNKHILAFGGYQSSPFRIN